MTRDIEAKPVGIYRSLLERGWAKVFVELGIPFVYEPERHGTWLPDFLLTDSWTLIEIKPTKDIANTELAKARDGMFEAYKAHHDIAVIVGEGLLMTSGPEIYLFADATYKSGKDDFLREYPSQFVRCAVCHHYFFIGLGDYRCRCCGAWDGDHLLEAVRLFV